MPLKIAIPKETIDDEKRVAATPETVKKIISMGAEVSVQIGAGENAYYKDNTYKEAGAKLFKSTAELYKDADIILTVRGDKALENASGQKVIGILSNSADANTLPQDLAKSYAKEKLEVYALERAPRISRAQSIDVLSSQSNLAGYKAVLDAAAHYGRAFPMMMTAAGTIPPAKVFIMGAGVAGLQAIATARRLGAVVTATDVRPAAKEQVQSLGASFIAVEDEEFKEAESTSGYAKPMSAAYQKKQSALVAEHIQKQDIVITTALIPGRPAPKLIDEAMVKSMKAGSVIVDMAVETGGNCALSKAGKVTEAHGVTLVGYTNIPSRLAADASSLYARNILNFLKMIIKDGKLEIDNDDEIIKAITLTRGGKVVHPDFASSPKAAPATKPAVKASVKKKTTPSKPAKTGAKKTAEKPKPKAKTTSAKTTPKKSQAKKAGKS